MRMTKIIIIIPGHDDWPFSSKIRKGELHLTESVCPRDFLGELEYWGLSALHIGLFSLLESVMTKILLSNIWDFSCRAVLCLHNATRCLAAACRRSRRPDCKKDSTKCHKKVKAQRKIMSTRKTTLRVCGGQPYGGRSGGFWRIQIPRPLPRCRKNDWREGGKKLILASRRKCDRWYSGSSHLVDDSEALCVSPQVLVIVSSLFLVTSIALLILSTIPPFQVSFCFYSISKNSTPQHTDNENHHEESDFFQMAEATFVVWFTLEYIIRLIVSPKKAKEHLHLHLHRHLHYIYKLTEHPVVLLNAIF